MKILAAALLTGSALFLAACSSPYYGAMEKLGFPKRDILVSRVEKARDAQEAAKEQFTDALTQFLALTKIEPGKIKSVYEKLNGELKDCESRAKAVRDRIAAVEDVSDALFKEWRKEAASISDAGDRAESERLLRETRDRANALLHTMRAAASRMDPILAKFRDKVLVLKANLNAMAVAGLSGTATSLEADVSRLVQDMEKSIQEASAFLAGIKG